jgi:hypothetical protein
VTTVRPDAGAPRLRIALVVAVVLVVVGEVVFLYLLAPGRLQPTFTGMQPDSMQYLCRGLQVSPVSNDAVVSMFDSIATRFGYAGQQCTEDSPVPWFFYSRLLLPWLTAIVAIPKVAAIIPFLGAFLYAAFAFVWTRVFVGRLPSASRRGRVLLFAVCLAPLASPTLAIWLGAFLTESLSLVFLTLSLVVLAARGRFGGSSALAVLVLGVLMLITRQLAPIVAGLWFVAVLLLLRARRPGWMSTTARSVAAVVGAAAVSVVLAFGGSSLIEYLTSPGEQGAEQLQSGLGGLSRLVGITGASITSTGMDISTALGRFDLLTLATVALSVAALVFLFLRSRSLLLVPVVVAWLYGAYVTGFVAHEQDMFSTHFRLYLPAIIGTLVVLALRSPRACVVEGSTASDR